MKKWQWRITLVFQVVTILALLFGMRAQSQRIAVVEAQNGILLQALETITKAREANR